MTIKPDKKDLKILFALDFGARKTLSAIAREVGLSKQGVDYKIQAMIKKGIITKFYPVVDNTRLGYYYCRFIFKLQNMTREQEQKIIKKMISHKNCIWALKMEGSHDFAISFALDNLADFKKLSEEFLEKYGQYIEDKKESIAIDVIHFQNRFLLNTAKGKEVTLGKGPYISLDELDWKILRLLCKDARAPLIEIAQKAKTSAKTVAYRIRRMEQGEVILGYRPDINHKLLGYHHYKILFYLRNVTPEQYKKFRAFLKANPALLYIVDEIGICDIDIEIMLPKEKRVFEFIEELKYKFPKLIKDYDASLIKKTLKITYLPEE